jgi:hypothetical protein
MRSTGSQSIADSRIGVQRGVPLHSATAKRVLPIFIGRGAPLYNLRQNTQRPPQASRRCANVRSEADYSPRLT